MEKPDKVPAGRWTPEMDVKLLLAIFDSIPNVSKSIEWPDIAKQLGKTVEGVRQHFQALRRSNKAFSANGTASDNNTSHQKATATAKKRVKNEQGVDDDDDEAEKKPSKKRNVKPKAPKVKIEDSSPDSSNQ